MAGNLSSLPLPEGHEQFAPPEEGPEIVLKKVRDAVGIT